MKSRHEDALPLIMTHGWPGSVIELLEAVGPLTDPTAHGGRAEDAFDLVVPSIPGYGFSGEPVELGWYAGRVAQAWAELMRRLGYGRYVAQGGDQGAAVTDAMARQAPEELVGIHTNLLVPALGNASAFPVESEGERAAAEGNFELNAMRPIIINNVLHSARILGDEGTSLREAALALGVSAADFDRIVRPETMVGHPRRDLGIERAGNGQIVTTNSAPAATRGPSRTDLPAGAVHGVAALLSFALCRVHLLDCPSHLAPPDADRAARGDRHRRSQPISMDVTRREWSHREASSRPGRQTWTGADHTIELAPMSWHRQPWQTARWARCRNAGRGARLGRRRRHSSASRATRKRPSASGNAADLAVS